MTPEQHAEQDTKEAASSVRVREAENQNITVELAILGHTAQYNPEPGSRQHCNYWCLQCLLDLHWPKPDAHVLTLTLGSTNHRSSRSTACIASASKSHMSVSDGFSQQNVGGNIGNQNTATKPSGRNSLKGSSVSDFHPYINNISTFKATGPFLLFDT